MSRLQTSEFNDILSEFDKGELVIRTIAMPADTNPAGDIFGGWILAQMDLAAGNLAAKVAKGRCATVAVEDIQFLRPVRVGDELSVFAKLLKTGRSSMTMKIQAWRRRRDQAHSEAVTEAQFVFVAMDQDGKSRPLSVE